VGEALHDPPSKDFLRIGTGVLNLPALQSPCLYFNLAVTIYFQGTEDFKSPASACLVATLILGGNCIR
jgi:hypothetical protein